MLRHDFLFCCLTHCFLNRNFFFQDLIDKRSDIDVFFSCHFLKEGAHIFIEIDRGLQLILRSVKFALLRIVKIVFFFHDYSPLLEKYCSFSNRVALRAEIMRTTSILLYSRYV